MIYQDNWDAWESVFVHLGIWCMVWSNWSLVVGWGNDPVADCAAIAAAVEG